jgi:hypothetical protein
MAHVYGTLNGWVIDGWSLYILDFIHWLCMHHELDEQMRYVSEMQVIVYLYILDVINI